MWIHDFERKKCHISSIIQCLGVKGILNLKSFIFLFAVQLDAGVPCYQPLQAGEMLALVLVGLLTEKCLTHDIAICAISPVLRSNRNLCLWMKSIGSSCY